MRNVIPCFFQYFEDPNGDDDPVSNREVAEVSFIPDVDKGDVVRISVPGHEGGDEITIDVCPFDLTHAIVYALKNPIL